MKKSKNIGVYIGMVFIALLAMSMVTSAIEVEETTLYVDIDDNWEHKQAGDVFVVRADIENIGDADAICVQVYLEQIPDDWVVTPDRYMESMHESGDDMTRYFIIERGESDATIHASAEAFNANKVISEKIPIPISPFVVFSCCSVFGLVLFRRRRKLMNC